LRHRARARVRHEVAEAVQQTEHAADADEARELRAGGAEFQPLHGAEPEAGLHGDLLLREIPGEAVTRETFPEVLQDVIIGQKRLGFHHVIDGVLRPKSNLKRH